MKFYSGLPETNCGRGSTLANTERIRRELPALLRRIGTKTLLDAPCGDFNWMAHTDMSGIHYIGCDCFPENLARAERQSEPGCAPASKTLRLLDLTLDELPTADLMLCREFFQHVPNDDVRAVLAKVRCDWLLATNYRNDTNTDMPRAGGFRELNLMAEPFNLPAPVLAIPDVNGSELALWKRSQLPAF